jgi:hypothetical protein
MINAVIKIMDEIPNPVHAPDGLCLNLVTTSLPLERHAPYMLKKAEQSSITPL